MNWEITIPIIVALITSGISYFAAVKKAKLDMDKELEIERLKHKQELERLEREMEINSKSKEHDMISELTGEAFKEMLGKGFMQDAIQDKLKEVVKKK